MISRRQLLVGGAAVAITPAARAAQAPLYDTHTHIFTNDIVRYPIDTRGAKEEPEVLRRRILEHPQTVETLLKLWSDNGVEGGVGVQYNGAYKTDNRYLFDSADDHKDRVAPVVILDATRPETPLALRSMVREHGVTAIRLTGSADDKGDYPWFDSEAAQGVWAEAGRLGIVIELMYLPRSPQPAAIERIAAFARRYPRQTIVLDHVGWAGGEGLDFGLSPAHLALASQPTVHFKLTSINFTYLDAAHADKAAFVSRLIGLYGADRIMWGSDAGNTQAAYPDMVAWARAATAKLSATDRRKVLHDTGKRVFGRKGA